MHPAIPFVGALAAIGGAIAWKQHQKNQPAAPPKEPPTTPAGNQLTPVVTNVLDEGRKAAAANLGALPAGFDTYSDWAQKQSPALPSAHALYDYLKAHGIDHSDKLAELTKAFQKAHNANRITSGIGGQLDEDGEYDALTSGALTMYTGDPIPGDPNAKPPKAATVGQVVTNKKIGEGGTNVGSAMSSGFNVRQWLTKNGTNNLDDADLWALVKQFQHDMNTDPLFPGPAYVPSPKPPLMFDQVAEDSNLGEKGSPTRRALKMQEDPDTKLYAWL